MADRGDEIDQTCCRVECQGPERMETGLAAKALLSCPLRGGAPLNLNGLRIASRKGAWMTGGGS